MSESERHKLKSKIDNIINKRVYQYTKGYDYHPDTDIIIELILSSDTINNQSL